MFSLIIVRHNIILYRCSLCTKTDLINHGHYSGFRAIEKYDYQTHNIIGNTKTELCHSTAI